jgi:hypothetical protein
MKLDYSKCFACKLNLCKSPDTFRGKRLKSLKPKISKQGNQNRLGWKGLRAA